MISLIRPLYKRVFRDELTDNVKHFIKNLSYVSTGTFISILLTFPFSILAGRVLGPVEYGKFALVQSIAAFFCTTMRAGLGTAMIKYVSEVDDFQNKKNIISTTYSLVLALILLSVFLYLGLFSTLSKVFSIPADVYYFALVFAVLLVVNEITLGTLRGIGKIRTLATLEPLYSGILLFTFIVFISIGLTSFSSAVYSAFMGYAMISVTLFFILRNYLHVNFDWQWANTLGKYAVFAALGGLSSAFYQNIDKLLINKYLSVADVGIYRAYFTASINIIGIITIAFNTIFFPTASGYKNKSQLFKKINRSMPYVISFGFIFIIICELAILNLLGDKYPINPLWIILFAVVSICICVKDIYLWFLNSIGFQGIKRTSYAAVLLAIFNIALTFLLIPLLGITGALLSMLVSYSSFIAFTFLSTRKLVINHN